ncbi:MAG: transposase [Chloroflexi bacterium]|nr:transposase [Chloroflexota bacterium]
MPDHVHIVLGPSETCDIITFVGQFKNLAQRAAWSQGVRGAFWQKRFWDHFLRVEEDLQPEVEYVLNNPVRRKMVENWKEYPFCGSLEFDL